MSKSVRLITEEIVPATSFFCNWHALCFDTSGTPCYLEFIKFMDCLRKKENCYVPYMQLLDCLKKEGYDT